MGMEELGSLPELECPTPISLPKKNYENYDVIALVLCLVATKPTRIDLKAATLKKIKVEHAQDHPRRTSSA